MTVELISVGTEILLGNIVNTNAAWLSEQCARLGLSCYYQSVVGDNAVRLKEQIQQALNRSDIVILTGGLGPTTDDLTKETAAQLMGKGLVMDMHSLERVEAYFKARRIEMTENNKKQALCPEGAMVLDNDNGTAPGLILEENGKRMILLPGPPNELHPLFEQQVKPYLQKLSPEIFYSRTVKLCGIGESKAAAMIQDMIDAQTNPTIAPYAKTGEVHLRVTARAKDEQEGKKLVKPVIRELKKRFGEMVYTTKEERTLEEAVVKLLKKNKMSITCAESCTGGLLAGRIVNVAGASSVFQTGYRNHRPLHICWLLERVFPGPGINEQGDELSVTDLHPSDLRSDPGRRNPDRRAVSAVSTELQQISGGSKGIHRPCSYADCISVPAEILCNRYYTGSSKRIRENAEKAASESKQEAAFFVLFCDGKRGWFPQVFLASVGKTA